MSIINKAIGLVPKVVSAAKAAWEFARTTTGKLVIAALVVVVAGAVTFNKGSGYGYRQAVAEYEAKAEQEALFMKAKEKLAGEYVAAQIAKAGQRTAELQKKVSDYEDALRQRGKSGACTVTPDDERWLRNIR